MTLTDAMLKSESSVMLWSAVMVVFCGNTAAMCSEGLAGSTGSVIAATGRGRAPPPLSNFARSASYRVWTL